VEIFGFKSFGFKNTIVDFQPGLISISGPNGSGKSNILDAIIFALGENRPKVMRADKLRSLIHDVEGSGRRGPKMSRVTVHFDNSDRKIPVDSDTVSITREMDDKGENLYYLNQKKNQRAHILDLLEVANAGLNNINVVQQGTVTRISEMNPEEKRVAIEDLIGLSFFDEKKQESEKNLDEADRKLEIALAKMDEIKKRIDELELERNRKLRYDLLIHEINRLNAVSAAKEMKTIKATKTSQERNLNAITSEIKELEEQRSVIRKETSEINAQKTKFMDEVDTYNQAKAALEKDLTEALYTSEQAKSTIATQKKRFEYIEQKLPEIQSDLAHFSQERQVLEPKVEQLRESIRTTKDAHRTINEQVKSMDSEIAQVIREQSRLSARKHESDEKIKHLVEKLNAAKLRLYQIESGQQDAQTKFDNNSTKNVSFDEETKKLQYILPRLESVTVNHRATITELKFRIGNLEAKKIKAEQDYDDIILILQKTSKAAAQYETQIRTIKKMMHEDYSIAHLKEDAEVLGIQGLVYEIVSWDKEYERAVLAAGSDWFKAAVVKDFGRLVALAELVRSRKLPRLKIIPLDAIPKFNPTIPNDPDVIGLLSNHVKCDSKYSALKTFLFGNVLLVKSRNAAHRISITGFKTVTLEGESFEAKTSAMVVDTNSKIAKFTKIISMSTSIEGLNQSIQLLKKLVQKRKFSSKKIARRLDDYKTRQSVSESGFTNSNSKLIELKSQLTQISNLQKVFLNRNLHLIRKKEHLVAEQAKQESYVASLLERISIVKENYSDAGQSQINNQLAILNEKKLSLMPKQTELFTQLKEKESDLISLSSSEDSAKSKMKSLHEENSSLSKEKHELEVNIRTLEKQKEQSETKLIELREKEQELISTSGSSVSQVNEFDDKLDDLNEKERTLNKNISTNERQSDSLDRDLKDLSEKEQKIQKILNAFGFDDSMDLFDVESLLPYLQKEADSLVASLNAIAPEKYVEVSYGYRSMSERKNELQEERNSIVGFIESVEKEKRQTFLNAFDIVDKEIRDIFSAMTGGNAWLEMQNEDDIFSTGLSYMIQFQNKPKRESTSISGGEKTLAAVVFVLALQRLNPSPFYLFDEIDAHLDAPNAESLSKIIEQRSHGSQFLMVSLKDSVVEKAKLIYGVFQKNGVSHIVTYKDKRLLSMVN